VELRGFDGATATGDPVTVSFGLYWGQGDVTADINRTPQNCQLRVLPSGDLLDARAPPA
jgi:hypothetical protein